MPIAASLNSSSTSAQDDLIVRIFYYTEHDQTAFHKQMTENYDIKAPELAVAKIIDWFPKLQNAGICKTFDKKHYVNVADYSQPPCAMHGDFSARVICQALVNDETSDADLPKPFAMAKNERYPLQIMTFGKRPTTAVGPNYLELLAFWPLDDSDFYCRLTNRFHPVTVMANACHSLAIHTGQVLANHFHGIVHGEMPLLNEHHYRKLAFCITLYFAK